MYTTFAKQSILEARQGVKYTSESFIPKDIQMIQSDQKTMEKRGRHTSDV